MGSLHVIVLTSAFSAGDLIAFTTALLITVLLLVLTLRAAKLPGTPGSNIVFAVCALLWSAGGLVGSALLASGIPRSSRLLLAALAVQYTAAAIFPIPILAIWRPFAVLPWQQTASRVLQIFAGLTALTIAMVLWAGTVVGAGQVPLIVMTHTTAYNAALVLAAGAVICLRRKSTRRAVYLPSLAMVVAVFGASIALTIAHRAPRQTLMGASFEFVGVHLVLLIVLCAFFLFARFRYADVFIRYGVRILLAGLWASILAFSMHSSLLIHISSRARSPQAVHVFLIIVLANTLLLSFTFVDEHISKLVSRWLFHAPDYRLAARQLGNHMRDLEDEPEILSAVEVAVCEALELRAARVILLETLPSPVWPTGIAEGEIVEMLASDPLQPRLPIANVEVLIPIASGGRVSQVLLIAPGSSRPGLVMHDLNYLRTVAVLCGNRLDALRREREAVERQSRESLLLQQVTEAELRALRAQINPHFLFNSLNTIADLIVRDPTRAEAMTLRLAEVFRHVLANSSRPLTSIRDEIDFLRTYLYIEEVRFRDRLQVEINLAPEVAGDQIPSLILQPLVENALKHGLGPKPGPGRLWISADALDGLLRLRVEDDGMGLKPVYAPKPNGRPAKSSVESTGLGLANVADRLRTLYQDRASVSLEAREAGGTCATVLIPRTEVSAVV